MDAYAYIRVSGNGQLDGDGPDRQHDAIAEFAKLNKINILREFTESHTGKELDRPVLQELIQVILLNGCRTIIIEKLDRLARDIVVQESLIRDFQRQGITLLSTRETDLCSTEPTRVMIRQILGVMAEYERAMIVFRTGIARKRIREHGVRCEGRKPYGDPKYPQERAVVALIRELTRNHSCFRVAALLNEQGFKTRKGTMWSATQVSRIMRRVTA